MVHHPSNIEFDKNFLITQPDLPSNTTTTTTTASSSSSSLFRSRLFRIETTELLKESHLELRPDRPNASRWFPTVSEYLETLQHSISSLKPCKLVPSSLAADGTNVELKSDRYSKLGNDWTIPFGGGSSLQTNVVGSYQFGGMTRAAANGYVVPIVDLAVLMMKEEEEGEKEEEDGMILKKDYLNHRYFDKRNLLAIHIAQSLSRDPSMGKISLSYFQNDTRKLTVLLQPPTTHKFRVRLLLGTTSIPFPPSRYLPHRNNNHNKKSSSASSSSSTPLYNHSLAEDGMYLATTSIITETSSQSLPSSFEQTLILLKVWASQRGFRNGHDSPLHSTGLTLLLVYWVRRKKLTPSMGIWDCFLVAMKCLSEMDFMGDGSLDDVGECDTIRGSQSVGWYDGKLMTVSERRRKKKVFVLPLEVGMSERETVELSSQTEVYRIQVKNKEEDILKAFSEATDGPVFLDPTLKINYLARCSPSSIREVRRAAWKSLQLVRKESDRNSFQKLFLTPARFWRRFDVYVRIPFRVKEWKSILAKNETASLLGPYKQQMVDLGLYESFSRAVVDMLTMALGDRITNIRPLTTGNGEKTTFRTGDDADQCRYWTLNSKPPDVGPPVGDTNDLILGFNLHPETSNRIVDRGPPPTTQNSTASSLFQSLWDSKAQLRRFKDGAIVPAVIWDDDDRVPYQIVKYALRLHFELTDMTISLHDMEYLVESSDGKHSRSLHKSILKVYDQLSELLLQRTRNSDTLPLAIDRVEPLDPALRYAALFPPVSHPLLGGEGLPLEKVGSVVFGMPLLIQIRFEGSSKWPSDVEAMGAAKCAMLVKLAELLEDVGVEGPCIVSRTHLDVGYKGYSWRIVVRADQELKLLDSLKNPTQSALALQTHLIRTHVVSALHHSTIHALLTRHPSAANTVRLLIRWVDCHMMSGLIPTEAIELLVAKVYTDAEPLEPPGTATMGLLRVLELLSTHDWFRKPLIVDPNKQFAPETISQIHSHHASLLQSHQSIPPPPMFLLTPHDIDSTPTFTRHIPEKVVLSRASALARNSHQYLMKYLVITDHRKEDNFNNNWHGIFQESREALASFDVLFRIHEDLVVDGECSSTDGRLEVRDLDGINMTPFTRSLRRRYRGLKGWRTKGYKNLSSSRRYDFLHGFQPVEALVQTLRTKFQCHALFFYNRLTPNVIAMKWRPSSGEPQPFRAKDSEYKRPVAWECDALLVVNREDVMREIRDLVKDVVVDVKVLVGEGTMKRKRTSEETVEEDKDKEKEKEKEEVQQQEKKEKQEQQW